MIKTLVATAVCCLALTFLSHITLGLVLLLTDYDKAFWVVMKIEIDLLMFSMLVLIPYGVIAIIKEFWKL